MPEAAPILLLTARDAQHPFDDYLAEVLLTEGYACFEHRSLSPHRGLSPAVSGADPNPRRCL